MMLRETGGGATERHQFLLFLLSCVRLGIHSTELFLRRNASFQEITGVTNGSERTAERHFRVESPLDLVALKANKP